MAGIIQYVIYQDNRKNIGTGKFYARAVHTTQIDTEKLADIIQRNCTCKRSDVLAVLSELGEVMKDQLQIGNTVKLANFGIFGIGITSTGAESEDKFNAAENIVGAHVNFLPQGKKDAATGKYIRDWVADIKFQRATGFVKA